MRNLIFIFLSILLFSGISFASRHDGSKTQIEHEEYLKTLNYDYVAGAANSTTTVTFYGYGQKFTLDSVGTGTTNWWGSWSTSSTTGTLTNQSVSDEFSVETDSPTIIYMQIPSGTTVQYYIGGLK